MSDFEFAYLALKIVGGVIGVYVIVNLCYFVVQIRSNLEYEKNRMDKSLSGFAPPKPHKEGRYFIEDWGWKPYQTMVADFRMYGEKDTVYYLRSLRAYRKWELNYDNNGVIEPVEEDGQAVIIPFPLMQKDLDRIDKIAFPNRPLKPVFLEEYEDPQMNKK